MAASPPAVRILPEWWLLMALDWMTRLDPLRRLRCPFCFGEFAALQAHLKCTSDACRNDFTHQVDDPILTRAISGSVMASRPGAMLKSPWWTDPRHDPERGLRAWLDWLVLPDTLACPVCGDPASVRLCPHCHRELPPRALEDRKVGNVTIFGPQAVGKTTFLTVLLQEIRKADTDSRRLGLRPLNEETRTRYTTEYHDVIYGPRDQALGALGQALGRSRHAPTLSLEIDRRVLQPLVYELKSSARKVADGALVSFLDLAGEDWEMKVDLLRREGEAILRHSRGLLFLADPLRIPEVAALLDLTEEEANVPAADYVEDVDKLADFFPSTPVKTPLAICLNKVDRWGGLLGPDSVLHQLARSVLDRPPDAALDRVIHEEVRSALRRWGQEEFLDRLDSDFPKHRFFACSALGDAARTARDEAAPVPTPLLVERSALWLLEQQGLA
jgi:hypothetical protein